LQGTLRREATQSTLEQARELLAPFEYYCSYDFGKIIELLPVVEIERESTQDSIKVRDFPRASSRPKREARTK
jgi:hypothetical protein